MHAFVYRLVERLTHEGPALSRNRHFHTFASPEGKQALRIARRLRSIARDIAAAPKPPGLARDRGRVRLEIPIASGVRTALLDDAEWQLLHRMPAVRAALPNDLPN
ncbi:hypothetical protein [Vulgatibacter incomptus]|uniref:Uncharacterized protein n=1 Tax=Vulgatibacter incomptus TaxID=1391653 RepID=A0A0K1PEH6_9BACT|nr:hypothetical protein [Vulgatibacter incomptus]AKU91915.1 hypothetical protein AKJ08_2302 [Vulgatibacter incomptus]